MRAVYKHRLERIVPPLKSVVFSCKQQVVCASVLLMPCYLLCSCWYGISFIPLGGRGLQIFFYLPAPLCIVFYFSKQGTVLASPLWSTVQALQSQFSAADDSFMWIVCVYLRGFSCTILFAKMQCSCPHILRGQQRERNVTLQASTWIWLTLDFVDRKHKCKYKSAVDTQESQKLHN